MRPLSWDRAKLLDDLERVARSIKIPPTHLVINHNDRKIGRHLYLPVEVAARELPSKAWLAGQMAQRGFQVILGATQYVMESTIFLPPGLLLLKTLNTFDAHNIATIQNRGHRTAVLNEEAFGLIPEAWLYAAEMRSEALQMVDLICAHGDRSATVLRELAGNKVVVTGNPRTAGYIPTERGTDILVCMMAGNINGNLPFDKYMTMVLSALGSADGDVLKLMREQIEHECNHYDVMIDVYKALRGKFGERVKIRPHPVENKTVYEGETTDTRSFSEALKTAAVVVNVSGCGTGLEARLAGVPGVRVGTGGHGISIDLGMQARSVDEAVAAVAQQLTHPQLVGDPASHFAPVTLPDILMEYQKTHDASVEHNLEKIWKSKAKTFKPHSFHQNKFPPTSSEDVARLTGRRVNRLGWNTWLVR